MPVQEWERASFLRITEACKTEDRKKLYFCIKLEFTEFSRYGECFFHSHILQNYLHVIIDEKLVRILHGDKILVLIMFGTDAKTIVQFRKQLTT